MKKRFLTLPLFLLAALFLTVSASAAGGTAIGRIEIENRAYSGASFSCDVKLSGTTMQGKLLAVVCAESEQVKSVSDYPAAETVKVTLQNVADTDSIRMLWVDAKHMPLASPAVLRMRANGSEVYRNFEEAMKKLRDNDGLAQSGDSTRLLVSCSIPLDWEKYGVNYELDVVVLGPNNLYILQFNSHTRAAKCKEKLESEPSVRRVEFDSAIEVELGDIVSESAHLSSGEGNGVPDSWGVKRTGIGEYAGNLVKRGLDREIIVSVVDSGIDDKPHKFFEGRVLPGYDFVDNDDQPHDEHEHGTHVSGIVAACTSGTKVKILPVRVLDAYGNASKVSTITRAIYYATEHGANVINLSLRLSQHDGFVDDAIAYAIEKGVTVVVAAGNQNQDVAEICPAHVEDCITVAAIGQTKDNHLTRWGRSNFGRLVDLSAPGDKINSSLPGGKYGEESGTSMAVPHVSAAAALLMCEKGTGLMPNQISTTLKSAAEELPEDSSDVYWSIYKRDHNGVSWSDFLGAGFLNMLPFFKHTVAFDANGGRGSMEVLSVSHGENATLTANALSRTGYEFDHWNTKADGSGRSYLDGASVTVNDDMTLYAQWKPIEWTVTLDANDGSARRHTVTVSVDNPFAWPDNPFSRTGYTLDGWNTKADGSGTPYAVDASLTITENLTLYAQWRLLSPIPVKPISWGTTATHMDEYVSFLQKSGLSSEVVVAVVGSGVDASHPFLQGRLVAGYDFVEKDDTPQDEHGHSTHVTGIIADCTPDNVKIMPVRVLDANAHGTSLDIVSGISYAVDHGANVICLPAGSSSHSKSMEDAINYAISHNVTVVAAAGNYNGDAKNFCPAHIEGCITVTAVDKDLKRYERSNYGEAVDIAAPGVEINSCLPAGKYATMSGTSMATPYVAAAAAMLMCEYGTDQTPIQIADLLKNAAMPIPDDGDDREWERYRESNPSGTFLGAGFLDMSAFIDGETQSAYALLYDDGEMVFQNGTASNPDKNLLQTYPVPTEEGSAQYAAWYPQRNRIRTVTFADAIQPVSTALWFYGCESLTEICGLENLDLSETESMSQMFARCTSLTELDLSAWDTKNVTNMRQMFFQCASLTAIYASDAFNVANVTESSDMFTGCASLIGGSGTNYDDAYTDKEYAHIDDGAYDHGYFADKTSLLFNGVELSYRLINTEAADGGMNIEVEANETCVMGETLVVSATISTPDAYEAGSHKYIGYFAYENRGKWAWQQLRAWYIDGGQSIYTLEIPIKSCPKMGSNTFTVSVFPADNFVTGASLLDRLFFVNMRQAS